jgi:hypothetical protein
MLLLAHPTQPVEKCNYLSSDALDWISENLQEKLQRLATSMQKNANIPQESRSKTNQPHA